MIGFSKRVFLIFTTKGVGGAEKRLTGLWLKLRKVYTSMKLVCTPELFECLVKQTEFRQLEAYRSDIVLITFNGKTKHDTKLLETFINKNVVIGDKLHFIGFYPVLLHPKKGVDYLFSLTTSSFNNVNIKGRLYLMATLAKADKADILDPDIYLFTKKVFFFKKNRIFQTSNSYVDADRYQPQYPKKNWIVILGRLIAVKQILRYVDSIPVIHKKLVSAGITNHHFYILGYGPLEEEVKRKLNDEAYQDIPVSIQVADAPEQFLAWSKIILSLQKGNNYPSKSLLEGLAAGNIPVVTDTGTTDLIAPLAFSKYVPENFMADDLAKAIQELLLLPDADFNDLSRKAREFVMENYTIDKMANYYINFYGQDS